MAKTIIVYEDPAELLEALSKKEFSMEVVIKFGGDPHFNISDESTSVDMNPTNLMVFLNLLFQKYDLPIKARVNEISRFY